MKKHVWFTRIVSIALCLCCLFALAVAEVDQEADSECQHTVTTKNYGKTQEEYTCISPTSHYYESWREYVVMCSDCSATFSDREPIVEKTEQDHSLDSNGKCSNCGYECSHDSWNDDKCVNCGYVCPHTNKIQTTDSFLIESTIRKEYVHPAYHAIYGTLGYDARCTVCRKTFSNVPQQENYLDNNEDHDFDSNYTCNGCGYTCKHSSFDYRGLCSYCGFQCPHGSYTTNAYGAVICNMCRLQCSHNWQKNGDSVTCTRCNTTCTHTAERSNTISTQSRANYDQLSATQHRKTPYVHRLYNCNMCRFDWEGDVYDEEPVNENHSFVSGACSLCKYVCLHTSWNGGTCSVCGTACAHDWSNDDSTCTICGAKKACATHIKTSVVNQTDGEKTYTSQNETQHYAVYDRTTLYDCGVCGWQFSETVQMTDAPTGHTFDQDGVCTLCSHVCKHSYENDVMICPYCGMQAPTKVEEKTVEKALDELPQESKQALAEAGFDTAEKITEKLVETAAEQGYTQEKAAVVDVTLQVQVTDTETNEKKWVEVTTENFPSDGLEVTFDPPEGTNVDDYSFVVVHMFTSPEKAGQVEVLTPTVRDGKLVVTFSALSPVSISWKEKTEVVVNLPKTGDDSRLLLWVALLSISIAVTAVLVMKKRSRT